MAKREYIQRHLIIIKRLKNRPSSFEELHRYLLEQQDITGENFDISQRTFQRDIKDIYTIYGIEIKFNKSKGKYEVFDMEEEKDYDRIFESFETLSAINLSNHMGKKIVLERKADKGTEHLHGILYAIENNWLIAFQHQSYWKDEPTYRTLQPILIKEAQYRWYLVGWDTEKNEIRNFGLDRISNLEITNKKGISLEIDLTQYYHHAIGIETYEPAQKVIISSSTYQAQYLKSLPIHSSQKVVKETKKECWFELFVHPTNEFIMEVFKYNNTIQVIEPIWLRDEIKKRVQDMIKYYK
jgi:predicted DNA-binding transcriptional regulator YafY